MPETHQGMLCGKVRFPVIFSSVAYESTDINHAKGLCVFFPDFNENFDVNEEIAGIMLITPTSGNGVLGYIQKCPKKCNIGRSQFSTCEEGLMSDLQNLCPVLQGFVGTRSLFGHW